MIKNSGPMREEMGMMINGRKSKKSFLERLTFSDLTPEGLKVIWQWMTVFKKCSSVSAKA